MTKAELIEDPDCCHIAVWVCDNCPKIHIANFDRNHKRIAQVNLDPENLNALIVELMKLRNNEESESEEA